MLNPQSARYRAAFFLAETPERYYLDDSALGIEPVLVYQRKDGQDGRIVELNLRAGRTVGDK